METLFGWVHLSDIHVGHGDAAHRWDQGLVLDALRRDLAAARAEGAPPPDAVLVTGDVAFSGDSVIRAPHAESREYAGARAFLLAVAAELGLGAEAVFVVPGNHDVNRGADRDRRTARLVDAIQAGREDLDAALADAADRALLAGRMRAYLEFARGFGPSNGAEARLWWTHRLVGRGALAVRLVGFNTALLSSGEADFGKLRLGKQQLAEALLEPPVERGELVVVLGHHPLRSGWLADGKDADAWVRQSAHVHLSGHVHEAESEESRAGGASGALVRVVAGAAHGEKEAAGAPAGHGYSFGAVVAVGEGPLRLRIWPRRWSEANRDFRLDVGNVPRGGSHAEHLLGLSRPPAAEGGPDPSKERRPESGSARSQRVEAPARAARVAGPIQVYTIASPDDEALADRLDVHLALLRKGGTISGHSRRSVGLGAPAAVEAGVRLSAARVVLVLVSASILASDELDDPLFAAALDRAERGEALVIPIYLRPCDWSATRLHRFQGLPRDGRPIAGRDPDQALAEVARELRSAIEKLV